MRTRCRAKGRGGGREGCLFLSGGSPLGGPDGGPPPAALSPPFLLQAGPLCPEVTRVRCGCREPQATGYPPSSSAPGPEGFHGGRSQQQNSAGPQEAQETSPLPSGRLSWPGRAPRCLYLQAVSGVNVPPLPAQSGQPWTWGLALAQEAGLREEVRRLCAEAGARVRLPRAHSGRSDKLLTQSLDAKDGGAAAFRVAPGSWLVLGRPAHVCSHGSREAHCWDVC